MKKFIRYIRKLRDRHVPLVEVNISRQAIISNYRAFESLCFPSKILPVLKSNAYGHGLREIAGIIDKLCSSFIIVDSYYEALTLRNEGIKSPLLIIGFTDHENIERNIMRDITFTIHSCEEAKILSVFIQHATNFHIKIDTGMHRNGIMPHDLEESIQKLQNNKNIKITGLCSHFADAENNNETYTKKQIEIWHDAISLVKRLLNNNLFTHIANTAGAYFAAELRPSAIRVGIGLYGYSLRKIDGLKIIPVLSMYTRICSMRMLKAGESVGYNGTFVAPHDMKIATLPVGYFEGIDRRLSNKGFIKVRNKFCPIIGRVSMNITTIDISEVSECSMGERVEIIGNNSLALNSLGSMAEIAETIPYELMVHIPSQLRRNVI